MTALLSALTMGLILSLLALGVFISFRVFAFPDITVDGSITLGACVSSVLLVTEPTPIRQTLPWAIAAGVAAGLGESEFVRGACWAAPLGPVTTGRTSS